MCFFCCTPRESWSGVPGTGPVSNVGNRGGTLPLLPVPPQCVGMQEESHPVITRGVPHHCEVHGIFPNFVLSLYSVKIKILKIPLVRTQYYLISPFWLPSFGSPLSPDLTWLRLSRPTSLPVSFSTSWVSGYDTSRTPLHSLNPSIEGRKSQR